MSFKTTTPAWQVSSETYVSACYLENVLQIYI